MNRQERRAQAKAGPLLGAASGVQSVFAEALKLHQATRLDEAERLYRRVIQLQPNFVDAHNNLGAALRASGRMDEAVASYRRAIELKPDHVYAHNNLGLALQRLERLDEAVTAFRQAVSLKPDYADGHANLGAALEAKGLLKEAIASYQTALGMRPDDAVNHLRLGSALLADGRPDVSIASLKRAIALNPGYAEAQLNCGLALQALGQFEEAFSAYRQALVLKPDYAEVHLNIGTLHNNLGRLNDALEAYRKAALLKPGYAEAALNIGVALQSLGHLDEALTAYRKAEELNPRNALIHANMGAVFQELGQLAEAKRCYGRAEVLDPASTHYGYNAELLMPVIQVSKEAIAGARESYCAGIGALAKDSKALTDPARLPATNSFYLAYQNADDRPAMESLCRLLRASAPFLTFTAPHIPDWHRPADGRRIRVGFISAFFVNHTIGKLYRGFLRNLDRSRFEPVLIHAPSTKHDFFSAQLDSEVGETIRLTGDLKKQQQMVAAKSLDILFYPEVGMNSQTYYLAYSRLAPVQAVSWGHPDTTGIDTIDYFISADAIEPPDADKHYAERLIRFGRLPCFYEAPPAPAGKSTRAELGLPATGTLYGCPQSLYKFHPEFDAVLAEIAAGDAGGKIVLVDGKAKEWSNLLRTRWAANYPLLLERTLFLPHQPLDRFMELLTHFDVLLDPIHFGSGNTLYEAMICGTPIVTWPGNFMRGRIVAGAYRQMGIPNPPIVEKLEDYASMALEIGRNSQRRENLRQAFLQQSNKLFLDMTAVREFESFLVAAVDAAEQKGKVVAGWRSTEGE